MKQWVRHLRWKPSGTQLWFLLVFAGYVIRIGLMPITGQHDVMFMPWMTHFMNEGHFNLYDYLYNRFGEVVMHQPGVWAPYPVGFYLWTASWLEIWNKTGLIHLASWEQIWEVAHPARWVFLFKLAYLPFDLLVAYVLFRWSGYKSLLLWAWSPAAIYTPFMMGQNDIYATALATAALYVAYRSLQHRQAPHRRIHFLPNGLATSSVLLLGLGATFKIYPLLLLPPLVLLLEHKWGKRMMLLVLGCSVLGFASWPFLDTKTYVEGVLFNPEGTALFRPIGLFGVETSLFLVSYLLLLAALLYVDRRSLSASHLWTSSLAVLAVLFLWTPTPFYWLIWITPFLIALAADNRRYWYLWLALQIAFAFFVLVQHRELGIALSVHLAEITNMPNLPTAIAVNQVPLSDLFPKLILFMGSLLTVVLLLILWENGRHLIGSSPAHRVPIKCLPASVLPLFLLVLGLGINLLLARPLSSEPTWGVWDAAELTPDELVIQEFTAKEAAISGIRLRVVNASNGIALQACLHRLFGSVEAPLSCATATTNQQVENGILYFLFENAIHFSQEREAAITLKLISPDRTVTVPISDQGAHRLQLAGQELKGTLDLAPLYVFSVRKAIHQLVVQNILADPVLVTAILLSLLFLSFFLQWLFVSYPTRADREEGHRN